MKNTFRVLLLFAAIGLYITVAGMPQALAQDENEPVGFENVRLWLYPEYDDSLSIGEPTLLMMLEGQIVGVQAPARVRFLVPSAAQMFSAGSKDAQDRYTGGPPDREPSSIPGWDEISYVVTTDTFRVEYYDPLIIRGQPDRAISYEFRWLYPISDLDVIVQEPKKSSNYSVSPAGQRFTDSEDFASYRYSFSDLDDEPPLQFEIAYTKSDPNPSLAVDDTGSMNMLLTLGIVVGLLALFGGGYLLLRRPRMGTRTRADRRRAGKDAPARASKGKKLPGRFCGQCGKRLEGRSRFCEHCGAEQ